MIAAVHDHDDERFLTVEAASALVSLGRSSLYAAMDKGELQYAKFGRARRIPKRALLEWASAHIIGGWASTPGGEMAIGLGQNESPKVRRADANQSNRLAADSEVNPNHEQSSNPTKCRQSKCTESHP